MSLCNTRHAWLFALAVGLWHAPVGSEARAQSTSALGWVRLPGAESCVATQALAEQVEQRLGRRVFVSASRADLSLEGHVEPSAGAEGFVATLVVSDRKGHEQGRRVLRISGHDCAPLTASLVLVIAIAVDPTGGGAALLDGERALSPEAKAMLEQLELPKLSEAELIAELTAEPTDGEARRAPPAAASTAPRSAPRAERTAVEREPPPRPELTLFAAAALHLGVLPEPALGATLGATLETGWMWPVDVWLDGTLAQERTASVASAGDGAGLGSGRFGFLGGGLGVCPPLQRTALWQPRLCGGLRAGVITARGDGFATSTSNDGPWLEPTVYGGVWLRLGAVSLQTNLGIGAPLIRDRFRYDTPSGAPILHRPSAVTGHFAVGAGTHF